MSNALARKLEILLLSLAIVDDLVAVIIAFAFTDAIAWSRLGAAAIAFAVVVAFHRIGVRAVGVLRGAGRVHLGRVPGGGCPIPWSRGSCSVC